VILYRRFSRRGALVAYSLGMTGNQDRAARAAAWSDALQDVFMAIVDADVAVLKAATPAAGDLGAAERRVRAVGVFARSVRAVVALSPPSRACGDRQLEEDEMKHRDDSPENLERMRAELEARLDRLNAVLEAKGIVIEPGCWPVARADRESVQSA
jgi:ABC-type transport system involved in cytochrome bd biosynthesis fused ATPase/permease subunit